MLRQNKLDHLQLLYIYSSLKHLGTLIEHQLILHSIIRRLYKYVRFPKFFQVANGLAYLRATFSTIVTFTLKCSNVKLI
jgi:hypothetical protein